MKFIPQTEGTDCIQACLASLFELPIESVPAIHKAEGEIGGHPAFWVALQDWLRTKGLYLLQIELPPNMPWHPLPFPALGIGMGPLAGHPETSHAIVIRLEGDQFIPVWDPIRPAVGLQSIESIGLLVPRDPAGYARLINGHEEILRLVDKTSNPVVKSIRSESRKALGMTEQPVIEPSFILPHVNGQAPRRH